MRNCPNLLNLSLENYLILWNINSSQIHNFHWSQLSHFLLKMADFVISCNVSKKAIFSSSLFTFFLTKESMSVGIILIFFCFLNFFQMFFQMFFFVRFVRLYVLQSRMNGSSTVKWTIFDNKGVKYLLLLGYFRRYDSCIQVSYIFLRRVRSVNMKECMYNEWK